VNEVKKLAALIMIVMAIAIGAVAYWGDTPKNDTAWCWVCLQSKPACNPHCGPTVTLYDPNELASLWKL